MYRQKQTDREAITLLGEECCEPLIRNAIQSAVAVHTTAKKNIQSYQYALTQLEPSDWIGQLIISVNWFRQAQVTQLKSLQDMQRLNRLLTKEDVTELKGHVDTEDLKDRLSMAEIVERYTEVRRDGMALCQFHNDRRPSLKVYEKNAYCFSCGWSGDIFSFVQEVEGVDFKESLNLLTN